MPDERQHQAECAACGKAGLVGAEVLPYSFAKGVRVWLHRACMPAHYERYRAAQQIP